MRRGQITHTNGASCEDGGELQDCEWVTRGKAWNARTILAVGIQG